MLPPERPVAPLTFRHDSLVLDSCCLFNLIKSGHLRPMLEHIEPRCIVPLDVAREIRDFDLEPIRSDGLIHLSDLEGDEENLSFVRLASQGLHNGEAACIAIARSRGWAIATDDNKALKILRADEPQLQVATTPELVHLWAERAAPLPAELQEALRSVREAARYIPSVNHPLKHWWHYHEQTI